MDQPREYIPITNWAAFVDVETTGLSPLNDEIIEFSIALFEYDIFTGRIPEVAMLYTGLREPSKPIPKSATRINGITNEDVKGKTLRMDVIDAMIRKADFLVAHNAEFDRAFVEGLFYSATKKKWKCSMRQIPWKEYGAEKRSLQFLLDYYVIDRDYAHRAESDVLAALKLLNIGDRETYFYQLTHKRALPRSRDQKYPKAEPVKYDPFDIDWFLEHYEELPESECDGIRIHISLEDEEMKPSLDSVPASVEAAVSTPPEPIWVEAATSRAETEVKQSSMASSKPSAKKANGCAASFILVMLIPISIFIAWEVV
ncbi:exonuclease domain-containing protein [Alicyclobacillus shizuokensis]|uniref:exonuclease domain-containing protein n=1 Tax=Alicyclobacillus shizuokensis TaxID=392014 RepID=UPI000834B71A|nr:exonuclease domain-containing protein [Alicyclobacillus shizuokensis]